MDTEHEDVSYTRQRTLNISASISHPWSKVENKVIDFGRILPTEKVCVVST